MKVQFYCWQLGGLLGIFKSMPGQNDGHTSLAGVRTFFGTYPFINEIELFILVNISQQDQACNLWQFSSYFLFLDLLAILQLNL